MRAAIYARRSTEEHQAASLETQLGEARRFCAAKGWSVVDTFEEDAVSRAEFVKRPAMIALLNAAGEGRFDVVVTRDESRLGGDMFRTGILVQDLLDAGARLFYYFTGEEVSLDDPTHKMIMAAKAFAAEIERAKIAGRTREHLERKARAGLNVGGCAFGYDNVPVMDGERRARVEYRINESEAAVVREVFRRYAAGTGLRVIAQDLNARGVASPRAGRRGTGSWSPSTLHDLLRRERYRGSLVWGWRGSTYRKGTRVEIRRPASEWTRAERPDLAIVDAELWDAVRARIAADKRGAKSPARGPKPKSLLAGLARCAACGGPMHTRPAKFGTYRIPVYQCGWAHDRGAAVCTMKVQRPAAEVDGAVLDWLQTYALREDVVAATLAEARRLFDARAAAPPDAAAEPLEAELRKLQAEIGRIATAIATTDAAPEALAKALVEREARAKAVRAELDAVRARTAAPTPKWAELEAAARARLADLRAALVGCVDHARAALQSLLRGTITCALVKAARGHRYRLTGEVVVPGWPGLETPGLFASPTGFEQSRGLTQPGIPFAVTTGDKRAA